MKEWKLAKAKAVEILLKEGKLQARHGPSDMRVVRLMGIRYPDGSMPRKSQVRKALKSWLRTGNRIIQKPYWAEVGDQMRAERANAQADDAKLLDTAARSAVMRARKKRTPQFDEVNSDAFLNSYEWRRVRMFVLKRDGAKCACCGATPADGVKMNVDHIKPRKLFPQLALDPSNLQVLCEVCNHGKGNWDCTDWRPAPHLSALDLDAHRRLAEIARK